jgi:hypothetical protein
MKTTKKKSTTFYFSELALFLLKRLAKRNGISMASFLESVIRKEAREQGIDEKDFQDQVVPIEKE